MRVADGATISGRINPNVSLPSTNTHPGDEALGSVAAKHVCRGTEALPALISVNEAYSVAMRAIALLVPSDWTAKGCLSFHAGKGRVRHKRRRHVFRPQTFKCFAASNGKPQGPVVLVDNYDSFTYNLSQVDPHLP